LLKNALESFGKILCRIVGGNDDGNSGHGKVPLVAVSGPFWSTVNSMTFRGN
jgi:hypothetical protein